MTTKLKRPVLLRLSQEAGSLYIYIDIICSVFIMTEPISSDFETTSF